MALLQPTPECYGLFDDVMLMRDGAIVYHGPRPELPGYLEGLGFLPPAAMAAGRARQNSDSHKDGKDGKDVKDDGAIHPEASNGAAIARQGSDGEPAKSVDMAGPSAPALALRGVCCAHMLLLAW